MFELDAGDVFFSCASADESITSVVTRLQQLYNDIYEAGLRGLSLGELSCVYWVCRLEHGDFWQEDVTNKCDITIRYVSCEISYSLEITIIV
jgi:hypothetical protein